MLKIKHAKNGISIEKESKFSSITRKIKKFFKNIFSKNGNKFSYKETILLMIISFFFGAIIVGILTGNKTYSGYSKSFDEFLDTYQDIIENYYQEVDNDKLIENGIKGMISYLGDPYSTYMNTTDAEDFNTTVEGTYQGIGCEVMMNTDGSVTIGEVFEGGAKDAGLKTGDTIIKINGEYITGLTLDELVSQVKGKAGTTVKITYKRNDTEKTVKVTRKVIEMTSVESKIIEQNGKNIGYISVSSFSSNTGTQFKNNLEDIEKKEIDSLIIDLRGNSGGYLTVCTDMISMFTKKNTIIYQLSTKGKIEKAKDKTSEHRDYPIVILVNSASASASEVFTAALQQNYGATVIGTTTYGKGKVQKAYSLQSGAVVKYTFQEWLTPKGYSIDGVGITPDIVINYISSESQDEYDNQLQKAISIIKEK